MQAHQASVIYGEDISNQQNGASQQASTSAGHPNGSNGFLSSSPASSSSQTQQQSIRRLTSYEIQRANEELASAEPQQILAWALQTFPVGLYQTTAFGLTGLAALDMLNKLSLPLYGRHAVPLIFINTLYHFPETLDLAATASQKYGAEMHVYMPPAAQSPAQFESVYGERLWEEDEESYDYLVKVSSFLALRLDPLSGSHPLFLSLFREWERS